MGLEDDPFLLGFESMVESGLFTRLVGKIISFPVWWIMSRVIEDPLEAVKMFCLFV